MLRRDPVPWPSAYRMTSTGSMHSTHRAAPRYRRTHALACRGRSAMNERIDVLQADARGQVSRRVFLERATHLAVGPVVAPLGTGASARAKAQHPVAQTDGPESSLAKADDVRSTAITRHGAYLCLDLPPATARAATTGMEELIQRLEFRNEFDAPHTASDR